MMKRKEGIEEVMVQIEQGENNKKSVKDDQNNRYENDDKVEKLREQRQMT